MYRQIIVPENTKIFLQLPTELVGKEIEITAEEVKHSATKKHKSKKRIELEKFFGKYSFDVAKLKLTRDEANER